MTKKSSGTVLVIEDKLAIRHFVSRLLELESYSALEAEDGETGLKLLGENRVDLVLLDLHLPGRDGWSVLKEIRSRPELSDVAVVILTASASATEQDRALAAGASDYIIKPVSATDLARAVARVIDAPKR